MPTSEFSFPANLPINRKAGRNGGRHKTGDQVAGQSVLKPRFAAAQPELSAAASADLTDKLLGEIKTLSSADDAALWAHRRLIEKNTLSATDVQRVEETFRTRLLAFATPNLDAADDTKLAIGEQSVETNQPHIDKSALPFPEPRRVRDRDHIRYVIKQPCLICGRRPSDPHHLRFAQLRALGRKVSDEFTVALCRVHHREVHHCGDEAAWWQKAGIDPIVSARALWLRTHPLPPTRTMIGSDRTTSDTRREPGKGQV